MILTSMILGAIVTAGVVGIVAAFWNDIIDFLKKALQKVMSIVNGVVHGTRIFIQKLYEGVKEISRYYSQVDSHWQETIITKTIPESQVPEDILKRAGYATELDITDELKAQLTA